MSPRLIALFDAEMRARPPHESGQTIEDVDGVVRTRGRYNAIVYSQPALANARRVVAAQAAFFTRLGEDVEWKLYAHDAPGLAAALAAHGFERGELETLMVLDLVAASLRAPAPHDVELRVVSSAGDLATYARVATEAFGTPSSSAADFALRLFGADSDTLAFVASVNGEPAAVARLELPAGRQFASLWGGGTRPGLRNRGLYRALVFERARIARARGYAYLTVDARETSRPILERLGFVALTTVRAWDLRIGISRIESEAGSRSATDRSASE